MAMAVKIYTKTGDGGATSLFGGKRVDKNHLRIEAYGNVDELNSLIGVILSVLLSLRGPQGRSNLEIATSSHTRSAMTYGVKNIKDKLIRVQTELFVLGADLATPVDVKTKVPRITKRHITRLEEEIDSWSDKLPKLRNFILPGGNKVGSKLHLARSVARRAERAIVNLDRQEKINQYALIYINRLSDWSFVAARHINKLGGVQEKIWRGRKPKV